ncbi:TRAPP subunit bet5 [Phlyctochytrium planicorne]|nr:TRAPP subunit bet5 [Phlyctochytrium planicorne]
MTIYSLFIFDRRCFCIYHLPYKVLHPELSGANADGGASRDQLQAAASDFSNTFVNGTSGENAEEEAKLVYGVVFSLRNVVTKLVTGKPSNEGFISYKTNVYKLHYYETLSGMKFVLMTDPDCESMRDTLRQIFGSIYVEYVVKNPLQPKGPPPPPEVPPGKKKPPPIPSPVISNELFKTNLIKYLRSLPAF